MSSSEVLYSATPAKLCMQLLGLTIEHRDVLCCIMRQSQHHGVHHGLENDWWTQLIALYLDRESCHTRPHLRMRMMKVMMVLILMMMITVTAFGAS